MSARLALVLIVAITATAALLSSSVVRTGAALSPPPPPDTTQHPPLPPYPVPPKPAAAPHAPAWASPGVTHAAKAAPIPAAPPCAPGTTSSNCGSHLAAPANDFTASATVIANPLPFTATQSTVDATLEPGEPLACGAGSATVWFTFTPSASGTLVADTFGSTFDTVIQVYPAGGSPPFGVTSGPCNDDAGLGTLQSKLFVPVSAGSTYFFQLGGFGGATGDLMFHLDVLPPPTCPSSPTFSFTAPDPIGDAFGHFAPNHDITSVSGSGDATNFCLSVGFSAPVDRPMRVPATRSSASSTSTPIRTAPPDHPASSTPSVRTPRTWAATSTSISSAFTAASRW